MNEDTKEQSMTARESGIDEGIENQLASENNDTGEDEENSEMVKPDCDDRPDIDNHEVKPDGIVENRTQMLRRQRRVFLIKSIILASLIGAVIGAILPAIIVFGLNSKIKNQNKTISELQDKVTAFEKASHNRLAELFDKLGQSNLASERAMILLMYKPEPRDSKEYASKWIQEYADVRSALWYEAEQWQRRDTEVFVREFIKLGIFDHLAGQQRNSSESFLNATGEDCAGLDLRVMARLEQAGILDRAFRGMGWTLYEIPKDVRETATPEELDILAQFDKTWIKDSRKLKRISEIEAKIRKK